MALDSADHGDALQRQLEELANRHAKHGSQAAQGVQRQADLPPLPGGDQPEADLCPVRELLHGQPQALASGAHGPPRDLVVAESRHDGHCAVQLTAPITSQAAQGPTAENQAT